MSNDHRSFGSTLSIFLDLLKEKNANEREKTSNEKCEEEKDG